MMWVEREKERPNSVNAKLGETIFPWKVESAV